MDSGSECSVFKSQQSVLMNVLMYDRKTTRKEQGVRAPKNGGKLGANRTYFCGF